MNASRGIEAAIPNFYLVMDRFEADLLVLRTSGHIVEVEIKTNRSDFQKDLRDKSDKHEILSQGETLFKFSKSGSQVEYRSSQIPNQYFFACPEGVISPEDVPDHCGLISVNPEDAYYRVAKKAPFLHRNKVGSDLMIKMIKSYSRRLWQA